MLPQAVVPLSILFRDSTPAGKTVPRHKASAARHQLWETGLPQPHGVNRIGRMAKVGLLSRLRQSAPLVLVFYCCTIRVRRSPQAAAVTPICA
jgi:hypothetical protein